MAEGLRADGVYEFGEFRLLAAQRRLTARNDGRPILLPFVNLTGDVCR